MKTFTFDLNIQVDAKDDEEALAIAQALKAILERQSEYKLAYVDILDLEEC